MKTNSNDKKEGSAKRCVFFFRYFSVKILTFPRLFVLLIVLIYVHYLKNYSLNISIACNYEKYQRILGKVNVNSGVDRSIPPTE